VRNDGVLSSEYLIEVKEPYFNYSKVKIRVDYENEILDSYLLAENGDEFSIGFASFNGDVYYSGLLNVDFKYRPKNEFFPDFDDDSNYHSGNPWNDVFGPGEEADDANWNTRGE
tara:strand:- start:524 stop:865 length:342 start_codon:yes stop_codon:yes gene_type:complete